MSTGIAVGTSTVVCYKVDVYYSVLGVSVNEGSTVF